MKNHFILNHPRKTSRTSRWLRKCLSVSVVVLSWLAASRARIQERPWLCGSISSGYLVARVTKMPFWMLSSSVGRPCGKPF